MVSGTLLQGRPSALRGVDDELLTSPTRPQGQAGSDALPSSGTTLPPIPSRGLA